MEETQTQTPRSENNEHADDINITHPDLMAYCVANMRLRTFVDSTSAALQKYRHQIREAQDWLLQRTSPAPNDYTTTYAFRLRTGKILVNYNVSTLAVVTEHHLHTALTYAFQMQRDRELENERKRELEKERDRDILVNLTLQKLKELRTCNKRRVKLDTTVPPRALLVERDATLTNMETVVQSWLEAAAQLDKYAMEHKSKRDDLQQSVQQAETGSLKDWLQKEGAQSIKVNNTIMRVRSRVKRRHATIRETVLRRIMSDELHRMYDTREQQQDLNLVAKHLYEVLHSFRQVSTSTVISMGMKTGRKK